MVSLRSAPHRASLLICLVLALLTVNIHAQAELEEGPVPGKEAYEPTPRFSEAIIANGFIFLSGTPGTANTTIQEQTAEVLMSFNETLSMLGSSLDAAVMSRVFLNNTADFAGMNSAYTQFFSFNPPARTTVGAHILGGSLIEIDIMALQA
ncbi:TPA: Endoribonuclease L-PSP [Trebouxia sp. C0004]